MTGDIYVLDIGLNKEKFVQMEAHSYNTGFNTRAMVPEVSPDTLL